MANDNMTDETWFAVYNKEDGTLVSVGTVLADPMPDGLAAIEIESRPTVPSFWNPKALRFEPKPKGWRG